MVSKPLTQLYGYAGKLLRIDLTNEKISVEEIKPEMLREFLGGVGYGVKLLYDELPAGIDPLSPENKIVFVTGPLTGTAAPGSGSAEVCFKSPLTGIWGEARCGGEWGGVLRKAGYDFLVIEGKAKEPKYILIDNDKVKLKNAEKLKGKTTSQKDKLIKEELTDETIEIATIGDAGEKLVRFATIMIGSRAFGRCGAGAVMGAKNLLAIAVKGSKKISVAKPDEFSLACKDGNQKVLATAGKEGMSVGGTTGDIPACDEAGDIPTKNWRSNSWGKGKELYDHFENENLVRANPCYKGCVLRCGRIAEVKKGQWKTPVHEGAEYESICAFTFFVLNEDMDAAVHATYLCNEYGIDTISTGAVIAFAMDCYEKGILSKEDTDGLDLTWGNPDTMVELVNKIANRDGIGQILGEGTKRAAQKFGKGADVLAIQVKGLEGPAHDPRSGKTLAVMYGLGNRGMCHIHPLEGMAYDSGKNDFGLIPYGLPDPQTVDRFAEEGKGKIAAKLQDWGVIPDVVGTCKFYIYNGLAPEDLARQISTLTGWDISAEELLTVGKRVYNLQRAFNVREGVKKSDDMLPERVLSMPEFGKYAQVEECVIKDYQGMLEECYTERGWQQEG
jgi:aldehyde:ferredoxin oxidoreductase